MTPGSRPSEARWRSSPTWRDHPLGDLPAPGTEAFLVDGQGFAIALSQEYVDGVVAREVAGVPVPSQFEVSLKGPRRGGLVRWNVTVDMRSATTLLHAGGPPCPGCDDVGEAVVVVLRGAAVARGLGSLYADLDFTFELLGLSYRPCQPTVPSSPRATPSSGSCGSRSPSIPSGAGW